MKRLLLSSAFLACAVAFSADPAAPPPDPAAPAPNPATPAPNPGGELQKLLDKTRSYASLPRSAHRPNFRLAPVDDPRYVNHKDYKGKFWWIMDGEQRIGILNLAWGEYELLRFWPAPGTGPVPLEMPEVYHWATLRGSRINIIPQGSGVVAGEMLGMQDQGEVLHLRYTDKPKGKTFFTHNFLLRFDPQLGYIVDATFAMQMEKPASFEYANMLAGALSDSREERKRFQKCLWLRRDGTLCYMYQNPHSMMQGGGAEWTDIPETGGFVGWVAERDMNPFIEITASSPRTYFGTCSQWYDQHVFSKPPTQKGADGLYHVTATYRLLSLPLVLAKELEDAARTMLPASEKSTAMGFLQNVVNDFERPIPAGILHNSAMWGHQAKFDNACGHSGKTSLFLGGGETAQPIHGGTAVYGESNKTYRLSAWVRTRGVAGKAYLRINEVFYSWDDIRATHVSKPLTGDNDWTLIEMEFKPKSPGDPFIVPGLVVEGKGGTAWFDDLALVEIPTPKP